MYVHETSLLQLHYKISTREYYCQQEGPSILLQGGKYDLSMGANTFGGI